eukprot:6196847-Pleurochrysis_carterae.AAC.1
MVTMAATEIVEWAAAPLTISTAGYIKVSANWIDADSLRRSRRASDTGSKSLLAQNVSSK